MDTGAAARGTYGQAGLVLDDRFYLIRPWCWVPRWYHADASRGRPSESQGTGNQLATDCQLVGANISRIPRWSDLFNLEGLKAEAAASCVFAKVAVLRSVAC